MRRSAFVALSLMTIGMTTLSGCGSKAGGSARGARPVSYATLDAQARPLREDFNRDAGQIRLVFLLDPRCATCLRGLADIDRDLRKTLPASARFKIYVVHEPVIGGKAKDIAPAAGLLRYPGARHYWTPTGDFGRQVTAALDLRRGDRPVYAWDVWMIYGPEAVWKEALPKPRLMMHQLSALAGDPRYPELDSKVFAGTVRTMLSQPSKVPGQ